MNFLARQPILDLKGDVFAYELLFRAGVQNYCPDVSLEVASNAVLDTSLLIGLEKLTEGKRAFVNCPRDFLLHDNIALLPRSQVVAEILETIEPDEELIAACRRMKQQGYMLALDDFVDTPAWEPLVALAEFIKVDFRLTPADERRAMVARFKPRGICMLAEKIETQEEFHEARDMGYSLFQGYFFCRPEVLQQQSLPASKLAYLELLQASVAPEFDFAALSSKIKHEPSLTFRLLRYLNSVVFGLRAEVRSVRHALALLGERELRKWIAVVSVAVLGDGKTDEMMTLPLIRARFCELLAPIAGMPGHENDLFLMGLLSMMDAILGQPLDTVLAELPVRKEIKNALLARSGPYRDVLEIAIAHEQANWERVAALSSKLGIEEDLVPDLYISAVEWATALRRGVRSAPAE